jgi:FMN phosphatase YigB (HAD superfamily)
MSGPAAPAAVLFDLGGVLLPFDRERRVAHMSAALGIAPQAVRDFMAAELHVRLDRGEAGEAELAQALSDLAGRAVGLADARALLLSVFEAPNLELWALAAQLKRRFVVGGFSDNPGFVAEVFPPGASLEPMFWSCEIGAQKPTEAAFEAVEAGLGLAGEAILFIDDTPANVEAARRRGWQALVFTSNTALATELRSRGLL